MDPSSPADLTNVGTLDLTDGSGGLYAESGHLVWIRQNRLHAAPFDPATLRLTGTTVALGSLLLAACLFSAQPATPRGTLLRARIGVVFFCLQTVLLDAIIWPNAFSL